MPKVKPKRSAPSVDMTAMVDVAFLLLTFFILMTKFKTDEKVVVDTPKAQSVVDIAPDVQQNMCTLTIDKEGRVYIGFGNSNDRESVLQKIRARFGNFPVTDEGMKYFKNIPSFGVPIKNIPDWLGRSGEDLANYPEPGIPIDDTPGSTNELREWLLAARKTNSKMVFTIKGDRDTFYDKFSEMVSAMQDVKINKFNLITNLEKTAPTE